MTFTHEETEAVTQKIRTMAADYGLVFIEAPPFQTNEDFYSVPFMGSLSEEKKVVQFSAFTHLYDNKGHAFDMTFAGSVESKVTLAGTTIEQVVVHEPEALKNRHKATH